MEINSDITRNRAEEYGFDLTNEFVIPPYYDSLQLLKSEKPQIIEGGRGSGKTMLIRYLCHATQFSRKRQDIEDKDFRRIGVYWKMDIAFAKMMDLRGADTDLWMQAFINMGVLILSSEILDSLLNIKAVRDDISDEICMIDFSLLKGFDSNIPDDILSLKKYLHIQYIKFQSWVSNYKKDDHPLFYPKDLLYEIIRCIREQVDMLKDSSYNVYIDEYENLNKTQKKIVNTWVKQSQPPLVFNIAMKHQAMDVTDTLGEEKIVEIHDYRKIDLEILLKKHFETFASEIFLLKVHQHLHYSVLPDTGYLYDVHIEALKSRSGKKYVENISNKIKSIFPILTDSDVADIIINDKVLSKRVKEKIKDDLIRHKMENYFDKIESIKVPSSAIVILHALFSRDHADVPMIFEELVKYIKDGKSKFTDWIHNNLFGCILYYYGEVNRLCPLYTGYDSFVTMSKDNIRHFLELCYRSLSQSENWNDTHIVEPQDQMIAVKYVSDNMLKEIKQFGPQGNLLYTFALRLGNIFEELRKKDSQSEPEQNQFSVKGEIKPECIAILSNLVKWSVLYESKLTKQKGLENGVEYLFNPIYSAYFTISFRKKRRIELTSDDIITIYKGNDEDNNRIVRRLTRMFSLPITKNSPKDLFEL